MNPQLQGKRALVTGGNKGIGFAICQGLCAAGFEVILAARSLAKGKEAAQQLQSFGSQVRVVELDVNVNEILIRPREQER